MLPLTNWLASALPVADAVSFEFDDINVTAQHVMTQTAPLISLMAACSPFTTSSSKTIVVTLTPPTPSLRAESSDPKDQREGAISSDYRYDHRTHPTHV